MSKLLELRLHVERQCLRAALDLPGDDADRAELADRAGRCEHDAVGDRRANGRQGDLAEHLERPGTEGLCGLLLLGADLAEHGHDLAHDERQRDEHRRQHHPWNREEDLDAVIGEPSEPAASPVEQEQREADHHRREREGQVDDRVHETTPREASAHERERQDHAEDGIGRYCDRSHQKRELQSVQGMWGRDGVPGGAYPVLESAVEDEADRDEQQQRQIAECAERSVLRHVRPTASGA